MGTKVIFLDRDGTINIDKGYVYRVEDWQWTQAAPEALKLLQEAGFSLVVITNQSGIAHGLYTLDQMQALHQFMEDELGKSGVKLDAVLFCPHGRDGTCDCRKPKTGMADQAEKIIGPIDYTSSWTIGDKAADLMFGKKLGTSTALIKSKYWDKESLGDEPDLIVDSLSQAAATIVK